MYLESRDSFPPVQIECWMCFEKVVNYTMDGMNYGRDVRLAAAAYQGERLKEQMN